MNKDQTPTKAAPASNPNPAIGPIDQKVAGTISPTDSVAKIVAPGADVAAEPIALKMAQATNGAAANALPGQKPAAQPAQNPTVKKL